MSSDLNVEVRFYPPPEDLRRYFTTFYLTTIRAPDGERIEDCLHPEWGNLRIFSGEAPSAWLAGQAPVEPTPFFATGPTSRAVHFAIPSTRFWGIGLLPLGWARFVAAPADAHANLLTDGLAHPSFARFVPLARTLFAGSPNPVAELARIIAFFRGLPTLKSADERRIQAIHGAMIDPDVAAVTDMVDQLGMGQRTLERCCGRAFGFSPKILLRRQRFMRSLTQFMLDPSLKWIGAIDSQYHDQAQFVRDFREFMGMSPREYIAQPHPILERIMHERARIHGAAVQTLDRPEGAEPDSDVNAA